MEMSSTANPAPPVHDNSLYRRYVVRPGAARLAPLLHALGFSANGVCWLKLVVGLAGAFLLSSTSAGVGVLGMLLLQANFFLDAADGEVARLRGEGGMLSGEYLDKLFDHLPKTAMYFFWGYGAYRLTGNVIPLFCGAFFAAWNVYPRFCGVETLLERLDKSPEITQKFAFHNALRKSFSISADRGRADFLLTIIVHPAMNLLLVFFLIEIAVPEVHWADSTYQTRYILLLLYTIGGGVNYVRKGVRFFRLLKFS